MQSILYSRGIVPVQDYEGLRPNLKRSVPVGFDRFGNSYWILGAQETMTLFPFNGSGTAVAPVANTTVNVLEPCVLMRDTRGWWGYYSGRNIVEFFNSFSSDIACESVLKGLLVVKYSFALRMLKTSTLKIKAFQQDWYTRRVRSEPWVNQYRWRDDLPKEEKVRLLEVCWARSAEVRMYSHYAFLNSDGDDLAFKGVSRAERDAEQRRVKKLKELLEGALPDHHPTHGWLRYDKLTRLLDLSCMTTSTRLLADASIYRLLQFHLQSSPYLKKRPLAKVSEVVEDQEVIREAEGNQSIDNKSAAVIASYNGDKGTNMEIDQGEGQSVLVLTSEMKETGTFPRNPSSVMSSSTEKQRSSEENVANVVLGSQSETNNDSTIESGKTDDAIDKVPSPSPAARTTGDNPRRSSFVKTPKPRAVEQLHLLTGEVLRVYPAGKDAAQFMGISQSGISLCCTGIKSDSNGFKWRLRDGPIDFAELEGKQKTYEELIEIAKRAKMMESERKNQEAVRLRLKKQAESASIALVTASAVVPSQPGNNGSAPVLGEQLNYVPSVPVKEQIPLTVSTNVTSARLIKLKAELINILCILPEKSLLWPELSEEEKDEIEKAGLESANSTFQLNQEALKDDYDAVKAAVLERISDAAKKDSAGENPPEDEPISSNIHPLFDTVLKQVEKAVKKTTRRMRRKLSMDKFLVAVQSAESPNELLEQVKALENIIPIEYLFDHDTGNLPTHATTCADVAIRLYTLDRSISFHDIKGVEEAAAVCPYKVRTEFCARCYATSNCFGFIGHATKCTTRIDAESRYPNLRDPVKTHPFSNNVVDIKARYNFTPSSQYAPQVPYKKPLQPLSSFEVKRNGMTAYGEVDIELVLPYVPTAHECLKIESI